MPKARTANTTQFRRSSLSMKQAYREAAAGRSAAGTWLAARLIRALSTSSSKRTQGPFAVPARAKNTMAGAGLPMKGAKPRRPLAQPPLGAVAHHPPADPPRGRKPEADQAQA